MAQGILVQAIWQFAARYRTLETHLLLLASKQVISAMPSGYIVTWHSDKGFGFIRPNDGVPDVFCHTYGLADGEGSCVQGDDVTFRITYDEKRGKDRASDVRRKAGQGGRSSRSRSRGRGRGGGGSRRNSRNDSRSPSRGRGRGGSKKNARKDSRSPSRGDSKKKDTRDALSSRSRGGKSSRSRSRGRR